jgi:DNA-binding FadR family transcriptional regulator
VGPDPDVAERIEALLEDMGLAPGDQLPSERALAEGLNVSRAAVREAIRGLAEKRVVEARRGAGTFLVEPDLRDLMLVRQALEPVAARLAARNATDAERAEIDRLTARLPGALRDPGRYAAIDLQIHRAVARASHNVVLQGTLEDLDRMLRMSRLQTASDPSTREATLHEMEHLNAAIQGRRGARAAAAMNAHLARIGQALGED